MRWLVFGLLLICSCNIFEPFYDEGKSGDLEGIINDVEMALERGEPGKAAEYAERGLQLYPESVSLLYLAAVSSINENGINFVDYIDIVRSNTDYWVRTGSRPGAWQTAGWDTTFFFEDLSEEEIGRLASVFHKCYRYLLRAALLIADGRATREEIARFESDIQLSLGVSGILSAVLTVIDEDHDLENGFVLDSEIRLFEIEDEWGFTGVDFSIVCGIFPVLLDAQEALYDHYRRINPSEDPADIPPEYRCRNIPWIDEDTFSGELFAAVHRGIMSLHWYFGCDCMGGS